MGVQKEAVSIKWVKFSDTFTDPRSYSLIVNIGVGQRVADERILKIIFQWKIFAKKKTLRDTLK